MLNDLPISSEGPFSRKSVSSSFKGSQLPLLLPVDPRGEALLLLRDSYFRDGNTTLKVVIYK